MKTTAFLTRASIATAGALVLVSVAGAAAFGAEQQVGPDANVDVDVSVTDLTPPGSLALSVAAGSTTLTEQGSTSTIRQFTGSLPTVTVTDTRDADDIPAGAYWYVVGSASDFVSGSNTISADHLGWTPALKPGTDQASVSEGDPVPSVVDDSTSVGLTDQTLLAMASDSATINPEGSWSVDAALSLRAPATIAAGDYSSNIILSLFE